MLKSASQSLQHHHGAPFGRRHHRPSGSRNAGRQARLSFQTAGLPKRRLGFGIGHPLDLGEAQGAGCRGQQKMLRHGANPRLRAGL